MKPELNTVVKAPQFLRDFATSNPNFDIVNHKAILATTIKHWFDSHGAMAEEIIGKFVYDITAFTKMDAYLVKDKIVYNYPISETVSINIQICEYATDAAIAVLFEAAQGMEEEYSYTIDDYEESDIQIDRSLLAVRGIMEEIANIELTMKRGTFETVAVPTDILSKILAVDPANMGYPNTFSILNVGNAFKLSGSCDNVTKMREAINKLRESYNNPLAESKYDWEGLRKTMANFNMNHVNVAVNTDLPSPKTVASIMSNQTAGVYPLKDYQKDLKAQFAPMRSDFSSCSIPLTDILAGKVSIMDLAMKFPQDPLPKTNMMQYLILKALEEGVPLDKFIFTFID